MRRKYKKNLKVEYKYEDTPESERILEEVYDKLFNEIIQKQKQLRKYYASDEYKKEYKHLCKMKSILVDFLPIP